MVVPVNLFIHMKGVPIGLRFTQNLTEKSIYGTLDRKEIWCTL